jgi:predicted nucleic acid-binding protein
VILVDTDVPVDLLRKHPPAVAWLNSIGDEEIVIPGFVLMELIQGCRDRREQRNLERALGGYRLAWPTPDVCDQALTLFAQEHLRRKVGILDALIGQLAVSLGLPLHTFNAKHYAAFPDLRAMQPY